MLALGLSLLSLISITISLSAAEPRIFNVKDFGARADGKTIDTAAIQKALDACGKAGGGTVRFAPGKYLTQPIFLHSKTRLELSEGAMLIATTNREDYLRPDHTEPVTTGSFLALVNGKGLMDISITGKGIIDGSGEPWWGPAREAKRTNKENPGYTLPRPKLVLLTGCTNVTVEGVTLQNSALFHLVPVECENVTIRNVTVLAPANSPNTDGIDPSASRHVTITGCRIDVGDDNIAIKAGKSRGPEFACDDIAVTDCLFQHGHGMSIGSESAGGVRNLKVSHCRFENTENGIRIKSPRGRGGRVENVSYSDITMTNVDGAITITCYYPKIPAKDSAQPMTPLTPAFRNIRLSNIRGNSKSSAGVIVGLPESRIENVLLENVQISAAKTGLLIRNAKGVELRNSKISAKTGAPIIKENAEIKETASGSGSNGECDTAEAWKTAEEILARIHAPEIPRHDFSITNYGAVHGQDATHAIGSAIDACVKAGGGRVIVPDGEYITGAIHLQSKTELHLEPGAVLKFSTDPKAYLPVVLTRFEGMECYNYSPLIYARDAHDVAVTGTGTLDGQAGQENWWAWKGSKSGTGQKTQGPARKGLVEMVEKQTPVEKRRFGEGSYLRPSFIEMYRCRNVLIDGPRIRRSPMWELHPCLSTNVIVRGVDILSHGPNNDGCDPESCRDVLIEACVFDTGDDCIAIKSGRNNDGRRLGVPSENIIVRRCHMRDGHGGVVIGSEISGGCRNVFAGECQMDSPHLDRVLRLKSNAARGGTIENVVMRHITVGQVADSVLQIDFQYEEGANGSFNPTARNILMQDITVKQTPRVMNITGLPGSTIEGVRVCNSRFANVKGPDRLENAGDARLVGCNIGEAAQSANAAAEVK